MIMTKDDLQKMDVDFDLIRRDMYILICELFKNKFVKINKFMENRTNKIFIIDINNKELNITYNTLISIRLQFGSQFTEGVLNLIVGEY